MKIAFKNTSGYPDFHQLVTPTGDNIRFCFAELLELELSTAEQIGVIRICAKKTAETCTHFATLVRMNALVK